ncbi:MAG: response regulator transcription factor [Verrucomicrobiaceae bacterium]|jgi:two-component system NarL family response regulator|nr:response regulator transcription factor [Verrucomicrobiaceae bacterium]
MPSKTKTIRVLIVDDHFVARMGLAVAVNSEPDMQVVAQAATVAEAVAEYAKHLPDVVLMDYALGTESGLEAVYSIRASYAEARVMMLTVFDGDDDVFRAVEAGACGYLTKASQAGELLKAIRALAAGERYFPKDVKAKFDAQAQREPLSPRELETLQLIVDGLINKEIGARLGIADGTVKQHVAKVLAKLGAADRTRAAILAVERGIVRLK